jgi:hypothetical protein
MIPPHGSQWPKVGPRSVPDMTRPAGIKLGSQSRRAVPFYGTIVSRVTAGVKTGGRLKHSTESSGSQPARVTGGLRNILAASSKLAV